MLACLARMASAVSCLEWLAFASLGWKLSETASERVRHGLFQPRAEARGCVVAVSFPRSVLGLRWHPLVVSVKSIVPLTLEIFCRLSYMSVCVCVCVCVCVGVVEQYCFLITIIVGTLKLPDPIWLLKNTHF